MHFMIIRKNLCVKPFLLSYNCHVLVLTKYLLVHARHVQAREEIRFVDQDSQPEDNFSRTLRHKLKRLLPTVIYILVLQLDMQCCSEVILICKNIPSLKKSIGHYLLGAGFRWMTPISRGTVHWDQVSSLNCLFKR